MALFNTLFANKSSVYDMIFFSVKSALEYPLLEVLAEDKPDMRERWEFLAESKYNKKYPNDTKAQTIYENHAVYYPEFSKIFAITYGTVYSEDGVIKRFIKKIANTNEFTTIMSFIDILNELSSDGAKSSPPYYPMLAGHNTMNNDIPLLIKRYIHHRDELGENKQIPFILKRCLDSKPWESTVIDAYNLWKFNGYDSNEYSLMLISDFLGLKRNVDLLPAPELSREYWKLYDEDPQKALDFISLQSANQTNLIIQLLVELRQY